MKGQVHSCQEEIWKKLRKADKKKKSKAFQKKYTLNLASHLKLNKYSKHILKKILIFQEENRKNLKDL
jgi:hypothetical protein